MKALTTVLLTAIALVAFQSGCERHPASQTIPGYAEKLKKQKAEKEATSEEAGSKAPSYFPQKQN
jgi:hypothetical protein